MARQTAIPCIMMRGGTSRGPYFLSGELPADDATRDRVLLSAMGSPDQRQIDGMGGATTLTSKVAIVSPSDHRWADVDYLFAQVSVDRAFVDYGPTCGNMLAGVGPFAIDRGLVPSGDPRTVVNIRNVNTDSLIEAVIRTPDGHVEYDGETAIDGVPGTAAPILLNFMDVIGSKTGALFPTGRRKEVIEGVEVSCVDVAMPMVLTTAQSMGIEGDEGKAELDANRALLERLETVRVAAGEKMGLGDVRGQVIPKFGILSRPRRGGALTSRYFVPTDCHAAHAVSGAICVGSCALVPGTVADGIAEVKGGFSELVEIEHPSGSITVAFELSGVGDDFALEKAGVVRTARKLFQGQIYVPDRVWSPRM